MGKVTDFLNSAANPIGAVIGAVAGAIGADQQRKFESAEAEKQRIWSEQQSLAQRDWNEAMAEKQNAWNLNMWNMQNAYNSPTSQVDRLREAGLNPLYYGLDGSSAGGLTAAQPLGYDIPGYSRASAGAFENPLTAGVDNALKMAQLGSIQAQTEKTKSETQAINAKLPFEVEGLRTQIRNSNLDADAKDIVNKYLDQQQQAELAVKEATAAEADAMVQKAFAEIGKMDYEKVSMMIGWLETQEKILNLQKQRELTDKQMDELASLIKLNNANAAKIGLEVKNFDEITVIGTASATMKLGPVTVQQGEPITLAMKKAAEKHKKELQDKQDAARKNKKNGRQSPDGQVSVTDGSVYDGPIYD